MQFFFATLALEARLRGHKRRGLSSTPPQPLRRW